MQREYLKAECALCLFLFLGLSGASLAEAGDLTIGLKAWGASMSADGLDGDDDLFPGLSLSWRVNERLWISAGYLAGESDFRLIGSTTVGSFEEVDSDLVVGWSFAKLDVGVGYRRAEFTTRLLGLSLPTTSSGPMVYLGSGDSFGSSSWGYYLGLAYMFEDIDDDDGGQEHFNAEGGFRWASEKSLSILFGYRYKAYSGAGSADLVYDGPVVNLAFRLF